MIDLTHKKILVTGGHGFLGKHVVSELLSRGVSQKNIFIPSVAKLDLVRWENCVKAVEGQDVVIHLAALVGGIGANQAHPGKFFYDNIMMGVQLMEAARQAGVEKFTAIGTICAYPKTPPVPFREENFWDGYPDEVTGPYGLAKKMLLVQAQAYRKEYGFRAVYLLPVNLYGPGDNFDPHNSHVVPALIKKVIDAKKSNASYIEAWGTGQATREFLYVADAAEGIVAATERYDKPDPVNLGSGREVSIKNLVEKICGIAEYKGEVRWDVTKPDGQPRRVLDVSRAEREFGFRARTELEAGLRATVEWYLGEQK